MARRKGAASMVLVLLALGLLGVGVVAVAWWPLPDVLGGQSAPTRPATATVIRSASCADATSGDLVEVRVNGTSKRMRFDGCGHTRGQRLQVLVPLQGGGTARPATGPDAESSSGGGGLRDRVSWVLLTLAAVAGGGYSLLLRSRPA